MKKLSVKEVEGVEAIIDGVFLHGRDTPQLSHSLPKGQYTVQQAINFIRQELAQARGEEREGIANIVKEMPDIASGEFDPEAIDRGNLLDLLASVEGEGE